MLERKDAELTKKAAALTAANRLAEERTVALAQRADELRVKVRRTQPRCPRNGRVREESHAAWYPGTSIRALRESVARAGCRPRSWRR